MDDVRIRQILLRDPDPVQFPSGVDPSVPLILLFLALAWWSWTNWQRRIFITERDPLIPDLEKLKPDLTSDLQKLLENKPFPQDWYARIAGFAVAGTIAGWRWLPSLESRPYDWLFLTLLSITGAALLTTAWVITRSGGICEFCWKQSTCILCVWR